MSALQFQLINPPNSPVSVTPILQVVKLTGVNDSAKAMQRISVIMSESRMFLAPCPVLSPHCLSILIMLHKLGLIPGSGLHDFSFPRLQPGGEGAQAPKLTARSDLLPTNLGWSPDLLGFIRSRSGGLRQQSWREKCVVTLQGGCLFTRSWPRYT